MDNPDNPNIDNDLAAQLKRLQEEIEALKNANRSRNDGPRNFKRALVLICFAIMLLLSFKLEAKVVFPVLTLIAGFLLASISDQKNNILNSVKENRDFVDHSTDQGLSVRGNKPHSPVFAATDVILILIILLAGGLRFYRLTFQSLWIDEIQTMVGANPSMGWAEFLNYFKCCELSPPLFHLLERFSFDVFGYTDGVARSLSAFLGLFAVLAIYFLGKEMKSKKVGIIVAALTAVNYFTIYYSQEVRAYSLLLLLTILSYLFFIKVCKYRKAWDAVFYILFSSCLIYTHYFSVLVILCQAIIAAIVFYQDKVNRKRLFLLMLISGGALVTAYLPWIPNFNAIKNVGSFWVAPLTPSFFVGFLLEYFGNSRMILLSVAVLLFFYIYQFFSKHRKTGNVVTAPSVFNFVFICITIIIPIVIPYVRSILVVPFLISRYTIVILPSLLIAIAMAIDLIKPKFLSLCVLLGLLVMSLYQLISVNKYYSIPNKTQFRELTDFISKGQRPYPVVNEIAHWQLPYYLKIYGNTANVLSGKKEDIIDSILQRSSTHYATDTFWLVGAHQDAHLSASKANDLDTAFHLIRDTTLFDAWAQLYALKRKGNVAPAVSSFSIEGSEPPETPGKIIGVMRKEGILLKLKLKRGPYRFTIRSIGKSADSVRPHLSVFIGNLKVGDYYVSGEFNQVSYYLNHHFKTVRIRILDENNGMGQRKAEGFVHTIYVNIVKRESTGM